MASPEILAVLADEVLEASATLSGALADWARADDPATAAEARERYRDPVRRIAETAELLNLGGLQALCTQLETNLAALEDGGIDDVRRALLNQWPSLLIGYLRAPRDGVYSRELVDHFRDRAWPLPLEADSARNLTEQLANVANGSDDDDLQPRRPTVVRPEDVALTLPPDANPVLVQSFLAEAPLQAGAYTSLVEHVIRGGAGPDQLNEARRLVHSIKGAANTVGVRGVAQLTHHLEDLLEYLAQRSITPQGVLAKLLMDAADCLEMMLESLTDGEPSPAQSESVLQRVLDAANTIDRGENLDGLIPDADSLLPVAASEPLKPPRPAPAEGSRPVSGPAAAAGQTAPADVKRAIRVPGATIEEMLRLSSEMTIGRAHIHERLHQAMVLTTELRERQNVLQGRATDLDRLVTVQGVTAGQKQGAAEGGVLDALELDQYSELHGAVYGFVETAADVQTLGTRVLDTLAAIETALTQQGFVNAELHEQVMRARMVPAGSIEPRLARTVRQACDATAKRARFELIGSEVMLDDQLVNDLINPLGHLLRNAVAHGLEPPADRVRAGKPDEGRVRLSFAREGNHIVIRCEDDGAGLDVNRIHDLAVQRGLIAGDAGLSETEIARLILLPGFSTIENVSEVSGRGVGMDVVNHAVHKLKGTIEIQNAAGQGARFVLRLPLTLGSAHCLIVRSGSRLAAIPTDILDRVVYSGAQRVTGVGTRQSFTQDRESLNVHDLADLLGYPVERALGEEGDTRPVVVVNDVEGRQAVVVDALLSGRDLVIKNLGRYLAGTRGVIGAALLGDGTVLPILDLHDLLRLRRRDSDVARPARVRALAPRAERHPVLVVDDSLSVRQALTQLLEDDGYQVVTARDGVEALDVVARERPAAMLVDLEMPRMNGLELTQRLRERAETGGLPVIMITSRSSDKHRQLAQAAGVNLYFTKPYHDGELLTHLRAMLNKAA